MSGMMKRGFATIGVLFAYGWINFLLNTGGTVLSGEAAVKQLDNSDTAYVASVVGMNFFGHLGIPALVLLIVLAAIWWKPAKSVFPGSLRSH